MSFHAKVQFLLPKRETFMQKMGTFKQKSEVLMNLNKNLMSQCVFQYQACKPIKHHNHWNIFKVGMACGKRKQACEHRYRNVMLVQEWQSRAQSNKHKKRRFSLFWPIFTFLLIVFYFLTSVLQVSCCWKLMMSIFFFFKILAFWCQCSNWASLILWKIGLNIVYLKNPFLTIC